MFDLIPKYAIRTKTNPIESLIIADEYLNINILPVPPVNLITK